MKPAPKKKSKCRHPDTKVEILMGAGGYEWCNECGALKSPGSKKWELPARSK